MAPWSAYGSPDTTCRAPFRSRHFSMPRGAEILLADDERAIREALRGLLESRGYVVRCAPDGDRALALYREHRPDLLLLDVMMPRIGGYAVCEAVRREDGDTPIVFLTALDSDEHELRGLGMGADAYIPKTVSEEVLLARVAAALRRSDVSTALFDFGEWRVYPTRMSMLGKSGETVSLCDRELFLLRMFAAHPGEVMSRDMLLARLFGPNAGESALTVAISRLRDKLGDSGACIRSVRSVGYAYEPTGFCA